MSNRTKFLAGLLAVVVSAKLGLFSPSQDRYAKVVSKVMPAVVEIHVIGYMVNPLIVLLDAFNGTDMANNPKTWVKAGVLGSGTYINSDGYILTVAHLFNDFKKIESISVQSPNGDVVAGTLVDMGKSVDLALVRTTYYAETPYVNVADPRTLEVGQEVIAIGSPIGLSFSVSHGIISSLYRDFRYAYNVTQSDTAINPGNSGGPLFNMKGELVGVNSFIILVDEHTPIFSGIGFSVQSGQCIEFLTKNHKKMKLHKRSIWEGLLAAFGWTR